MILSCWGWEMDEEENVQAGLNHATPTVAIDPQADPQAAPAVTIPDPAATPALTIPDPAAIPTPAAAPTTPSANTTLTTPTPTPTPGNTTLSTAVTPAKAASDEDDDENAAKNKEEKNYLRRMWDYFKPRKANFEKPEEMGSGMEAFWKALFKLVGIVSSLPKNALGIALYPFGIIADIAGKPGLLAFSRKCMNMEVLDPNAGTVRSNLKTDVNQPPVTQVKTNPENEQVTDLTNNQAALAQLQNNPTPAGPDQTKTIDPQANNALNGPGITIPVDPVKPTQPAPTPAVTPDPPKPR